MNDDYQDATFVHPGDGGCPGNWLLDPGQKAPPITLLVPKDQSHWEGAQCGDCGTMLITAPGTV